MKEEKFKKLNISLPPDVHEWIKKKQANFKKENPLGKLDISPLVAHCIREMMDSEDQAAIDHSSQKTERKTTKAKSKKEEIPDNIIDPEKLYPNGLPPDMMAAVNAERRRYAIATGTQHLSKKSAHSASKKLPKKNA